MGCMTPKLAREKINKSHKRMMWLLTSKMSTISFIYPWESGDQIVSYPARWSFPFILGPLQSAFIIYISDIQRTQKYSAVMKYLLVGVIIMCSVAFEISAGVQHEIERNRQSPALMLPRSSHWTMACFWRNKFLQKHAGVLSKHSMSRPVKTLILAKVDRWRL